MVFRMGMAATRGHNLNMNPNFIMNNSINMTLRGFKKFSQFALSHALRFINISYFYNLRLSKFGKGIAFSASIIDPFFTSFKSSIFYGISDIFLMRSKIKMFWIYTNFNIALMANKKTFWNRSFIYFIRQTMGCQFFTRRIGSRPNAYLPVATSIFIGCPNPASFSFFDMFEKSFMNGDGFRSCCHEGYLA